MCWKEDYHIINKLIIQFFLLICATLHIFNFQKTHVFYGLFIVLRMYMFKKQQKKNNKKIDYN